MRQWRHGDATFPVRHQRRGATCQLEGCERPQQSLGWCQAHYQRVVATGEPGPVEFEEKMPNAGLTCSGPECTDAAISKGMCAAHYNQQIRYGSLKPKRKIKPREGPCEATECGKPRLSEGKCRTHYTRWQAGEPDWDRPIKAIAAPGSGHVDKNGYRFITVDGRNVPEHRWVMEQHIGRALRPEETVHHKTGGFKGRSNNALSNLELWTGMHPKGHRVEDVATYCLEWLSEYAPPDLAELCRAYLDGSWSPVPRTGAEAVSA